MSGQIGAAVRSATAYCPAIEPAYVILNNENLPIGLASPALGKTPLCSRPAGLAFTAPTGAKPPPNSRNCADRIADAISRFPRFAA